MLTINTCQKFRICRNNIGSANVCAFSALHFVPAVSPLPLTLALHELKLNSSPIIENWKLNLQQTDTLVLLVRNRALRGLLAVMSSVHFGGTFVLSLSILRIHRLARFLVPFWDLPTNIQLGVRDERMRVLNPEKLR